MNGRHAAAFGALVCGLSVALAAWASHGADPAARVRLALAAAIAFGHGLALVAIADRSGKLLAATRVAFVLGIALFSGSLVGAVVFGTATALAPAGGLALMAGWAILAAHFLRGN
jgi:uncharacterized membrane protein YgdD (TMEM256/DUF423 family)